MSCFYRINASDKNNKVIQSPILTEDQFKYMLLYSQASSTKGLLQFSSKSLYSLADEQKTNIEKAKEKRLKMKKGQNSPDYNFESAISACTFIEQHLPNMDGLQAAVNDEAFRNWVISSQINPEIGTKEERGKLADEIIRSWRLIESDSIDLHNVMPVLWNYIDDDNSDEFEQIIADFSGINNDNGLYKKLSNTTKRGISGIELLRQQMKNLNAKLNTLAKVEVKKSKLYTGLHFTTKLKNDLAVVGIHVDKLYLDASGKLHVINFKFTSSDPSTWSINKIKKYEYEMAMIKKILADNGLDTRGATFVNIPIILQYDGDNTIDIRIPQNSSDGIISYNVSSLSKGSVTSPIAQRELEIDKYFNTPEFEFKNIKVGSDLSKADLFLKTLNPEYDVNSEGLKISAKEWIRSEYDKGNITLDHTKSKYKVILPDGSEVYVDSLTHPTRNQDILEVVQENLDKINLEKTIIMPELIKGLKNAYIRKQTYFDARGFKFNQGYLQSTLSKYFQKHDIDGEEYIWELITESEDATPLADRGILLFLNKQTKQIDVVITSPFQCKALIPMKYSQKGILGQYTMDLGSTSVLSATYGNMELMRVAAVLNEVKNDLPEGSKLGDIKLITPYNRGEGLRHDAKYVINEYSKLCRFLNKVSEENNFKNNFSQNDFVDQLVLIFDAYNEIINLSNASQSSNLPFDIEGLKNQKLLAGQLQAIEELIVQIETSNKIGASPEEIIQNLNSADPIRRGIATIYTEAVKFLNYHTGFKRAQVAYISKFERVVMPQYANSDENVRHISNLYTKALDRIAQEFQTSYGPIRFKVIEFKEKQGFSKLQANLGANANKLYENFYETVTDPDTGKEKKTWKFVNPYDPISSRKLNEDEKRMLKIALFQFNKVRSIQTGVKFNFTLQDINSSNYLEFIENNKNVFFLVPLKKASISTRNEHFLQDKINATKEEFKKLQQVGCQEYMKDALSTKSKRREYDDGNHNPNSNIYDMVVENHMVMSEIPEHRAKLLKQKDDSYFETNLEYLLADYTEQSIAKKHLERVALYGRCMIFQMKLQGESEGTNTTNLLKQSASEIEDFLKLNVFGQTLLDDLEQQFVQFMSPARKLMTNLYIAANLRSAMRDSFEGLWQNMSRTISHYQTDLTSKYLMQGYKEVIENVFKNDRSLNICSELCLRYRLSNTDAAKISERAKTDRGGLLNPSELAFSTLRAPDFLNRMTLFVARCKQDGVWDAFSINDGQLVYNWKKDKRFAAFASENIAHPDYMNQKALYYNSIDLYNKEHGTELTFKDDLPEPYSQDEIRKFKEFSDSIYGAYDKSQKAKYEHLVLGQTLGVFSTWFNGHTAAWFRRRGFYDPYFTQNDEKGNMLIKRNDAGNELWFDENGNIFEKRDDGKFYNSDSGEEVTIENPVPVIARMPVQVQGIYYTLKDSWHVLSESGFSYKEFKKNVLDYKCNRDNFRKLATELLFLAILSALFGFVFTPMYDDHKKRKDMDNILQDALVELLFKAGANSFEGFMGPVAVANYILNNVEPSAANVSVKVTTDLWKVLLGDKTLTAFTYGYLPVMRTFKDTAKVYFAQDFKVDKE